MTIKPNSVAQTPEDKVQSKSNFGFDLSNQIYYFLSLYFSLLNLFFQLANSQNNPFNIKLFPYNTRRGSTRRDH